MVEVIAITKTFSRASACVYCGKKPPEVVLTLEHIIPKGLKGYLKLPDGSCTGCASITKKFEQIVLRTIFGEARIHIGMGWGRKKEQPRTAPVKVEKSGRFEVTAVPIGEHPFVLAMVDLPPPGILWSPTKIERYERCRVVMFSGIQEDFQERIDRIDRDKGVWLEQVSIKPEFHRLLAKIAHSCAKACLAEIGDFRPFLPEIILCGELRDGPHLIGGADEFTPQSPNLGQTILHDIWLTKAMQPNRLNDPPLIVVCIQLFACLKMPVYQVVVGQQLTS